MLKEEILKKMLDGYYSKLPRHIIKDIINSYQEKYSMNLIIKFHHLGQITDIADSFWLVL